MVEKPVGEIPVYLETEVSNNRCNIITRFSVYYTLPVE